MLRCRVNIAEIYRFSIKHVNILLKSRLQNSHQLEYVNIYNASIKKRKRKGVRAPRAHRNTVGPRQGLQLTDRQPVAYSRIGEPPRPTGHDPHGKYYGEQG